MKSRYIFFVMNIFWLLAASDLLGHAELADGGEYCCRTAGHMGMYPGLDHIANIKRSLNVRSGGGFNESDDIDLISPDYWDNKSMDFQAFRAAFPILSEYVNDYPLIYLDSAATAQMPQSVLDVIVEYYQTYKANVGRGLYVFAERSTQMFEAARVKVANFIGAQKHEVIFTSGATASINLAAHIWAEQHIFAGDEIVVSEVEHNANFIPWQQLAIRKGAVLKYVPINDQGVVDAATLRAYISPATKLVAVTHQSNVLGVVNDVQSLAVVAHEVGAKILVDAAQSVAHQKIDVQELDCDFLVFSGHKLYGPTGVGVLYVKHELASECILHNFGGGAVYAVTHEHTEFKCMPHCYEPRTQAIAEVIGLGAAIDFVQRNIQFQQVQEYETALIEKLIHALQRISGITIISQIPALGQHSNLVAFTSDRLHAYDVAEYLNKYGIAVRAGYHCVQPYHDKLGGNASVRISVTPYNTVEEIDFVIERLQNLFA